LYRPAASRKEAKRKFLKVPTEHDGKETQYDNIIGAAGKDTAPFTPSRRRTTRAQQNMDEEFGIPPLASTQAATTPPPPSERFLIGRRRPMCTDYGQTCHYAFQGQGFFFCNPCILWDHCLPDSNRNGPRLSAELLCTTNHSCLLHPTSFAG
jgi:hypothetical protein